jgi:hypothetical protein
MIEMAEMAKREMKPPTAETPSMTGSSSRRKRHPRLAAEGLLEDIPAKLWDVQ